MMPPDSDSYQHILMNGALWYVVLFGIPTVRWVWKRLVHHVNRNVDARINLHVHRALYQNVTVLPKQRSAR